MRKLCQAAALLAILLMASSALAQQHATISLISDRNRINGFEQLLLGVHFRLDPGWHIYWINPGDSGQPPSFSWEAPSGFIVSNVKWPAPERIRDSATLVDYGYTNEVTFLATLQEPEVRSSEQHYEIGVHTKFLICRELCIPAQASAKLAFPHSQDDTHVQVLTSAKQKLPQRAPTAWKITGVQTRDAIVISVSGAKPTPKQLSFFPIDSQVVDNASPQAMNRTITGMQLRPPSGVFTLWMKTSDQLATQPKQLRGLLVADGKAYEIAVPLKAGNAVPGKVKHP